MILQQLCKHFKYKNFFCYNYDEEQKKFPDSAKTNPGISIFFQFYQIDNSFKTLTSSLSIGLSFLIALANGTYTILSFSIPIITFL